MWRAIVRLTRRHAQVMTALIWLLLCTTGAYAFARLSSAPAVPRAGLAGATTDYRISNITYAISEADPRTIGSVTFTLTPSLAGARIATVRAKLLSSSSNYAICINTPAGSSGWACPISGVTVAAADQLMLDVGEPQFGPGFRLYLPAMRR
jgi:hypothetical protein